MTCFNIGSDGTGQSHFRVCLRLSCDRVVKSLKFEFRHAFSSSDAGLRDFPSRLRKMLGGSLKIDYVTASSCQILVVLYAETCWMTGSSVNRLLARYWCLHREDVWGDWRKLHTEEVHTPRQIIFGWLNEGEWKWGGEGMWHIWIHILVGKREGLRLC